MSYNKEELKNDLIKFSKWYNSHTLGHPIHIKNIDNYLSTIKEPEEKRCSDCKFHDQTSYHNQMYCRDCTQKNRYKSI